MHVAADIPVDIRDRLLEEEFPVCVGQSAVSLRPDTGGGIGPGVRLLFRGVRAVGAGRAGGDQRGGVPLLQPAAGGGPHGLQYLV